MISSYSGSLCGTHMRGPNSAKWLQAHAQIPLCPMLCAMTDGLWLVARVEIWLSAAVFHGLGRSVQTLTSSSSASALIGVADGWGTAVWHISADVQGDLSVVGPARGLLSSTATLVVSAQSAPGAATKFRNNIEADGPASDALQAVIVFLHPAVRSSSQTSFARTALRQMAS
jgi:hypothetical protein